MDGIITQYRRRVVLYKLSNPDNLLKSFDGEHFVAILWATDNTFGQKDRMQVAAALIQSGCRYIVCGGVDCEQWHDDADLAWVGLDLDSSGNTPHVMTTWHTNEATEDVIWFAKNNPTFGEHDFKSLLVLVVGEDASRVE